MTFLVGMSITINFFHVPKPRCGRIALDLERYLSATFLGNGYVHTFGHANTVRVLTDSRFAY